MPKEYRYIGIKFDPDKDADILEFIECHSNMSEFIKDCIKDRLQKILEDEV